MSRQPIECSHCLRVFARRSNLKTHLELGRCKPQNPAQPSQPSSNLPIPSLPQTPYISIPTQAQSSPIASTPLEVSDLLKQIASDPSQLVFLRRVLAVASAQSSDESSETQSNQSAGSGAVNNNQFNNNLNVLCLTPKDDLLEMLMAGSNLKNALTYIKNCALAQLPGDCRLINKIYLNVPKPALMYGNKSKTQFVYYDENCNRTVETNPRVIAKILAENLQRSYLKGSNSLKDEEGNVIPVKSDHPYLPKLDPHDLDMWNAHIYELNDEKYQKKVLNSLSIPFESEVSK